MSVIENMPDILCRCKGYDPGVLFIVGRPKDGHVVCYIHEKGTIVPYWRALLYKTNFPFYNVNKCSFYSSLFF